MPETTRGALPELPRPAVCFADHSYPAFSRRQMEEYARLAVDAALRSDPADAAEMRERAAQVAASQGKASEGERPSYQDGYCDACEAIERAIRALPTQGGEP